MPAPVLDRSAGLLLHGQGFLQRLRGGAPAVETRLLGERALAVGGAEGVRFFYSRELQRTGALPGPVVRTLFGRGAVHTLDDAPHHDRKALLLSLLSPTRVDGLVARAHLGWELALPRWRQAGRVRLLDEAVQVLGAAVVGWAGAPTSGPELAERSRDLFAVVRGFAVPGREGLQARRSRHRVDRWAQGLVAAARSGELDAEPGTALGDLAARTDLPIPLAAVEWVNVVRPTVAVAWFVAACPLALQQLPEVRARITDGDRAAAVGLAQEVRRTWPFVPALAARARGPLTWQGHDVRPGQLVVLDVWGTDHDPGLWPSPSALDPDRHAGRRVDDRPWEDALVPQGGGSAGPDGHRCPGEPATVRLLADVLGVLARLDWSLPPQDLRVPRWRVPTAPRSGTVLAVR